MIGRVRTLLVRGATGLVVGSVALASASFCQAGVVSVTPFAASPSAHLIAAPGSVTTDALTGDAVVFEEVNDYVLPVALPVDEIGFGPGTGIPGVFQANNFPSLHPGVIPAGTQISSFMIHFDTPGITLSTVGMLIETDQDIIGVIFTDETLDATDLIVGAPGTAYPTGLEFRGVIFHTNGPANEGSDDIRIGVPGDIPLGFTRSVIIVGMNVEAVLDQVRIITLTPEPGTGVLAVMAGIALASLGVRTRRRAG